MEEFYRKNWATALTKCVLCGGDNRIIINKNLASDRSAKRVREAHGKVVEGEPPCEECQKMMKLGILLIGYDESKSNVADIKDGDAKDNIEGIYRSGELCVVTEDNIKNNVHMFGEELMKEILENRFVFMPSEIVRELIDRHKEAENEISKQDSE